MKNKKLLLFKILHVIGYICTFTWLIVFIILGVQSCNKQDDRQDKPINNAVQLIDYKRIYTPYINQHYQVIYPNDINNLVDTLKIMSDGIANGTTLYSGYHNGTLHRSGSIDRQFTHFYITKYNSVTYYIRFTFANNDGFGYYIDKSGNNPYDEEIWISFDEGFTFSSDDKAIAFGKYFLSIYNIFDGYDRYSLTPYMDLTNIPKGVYFPITTNIFQYVFNANSFTSDHYYYGFMINYDNVIYGYDSNGGYVIGYLKYDKYDNPYFSYTINTDYDSINNYFSGYILRIAKSTPVIEERIKRSLLPVYYANNEVYFDVTDLEIRFNWINFASYTTSILNGLQYDTILGQQVYTHQCILDYKIVGIDDFRFNRIIFGYNGSTNKGTIQFSDNLNTFNIYSWDGNFSLTNIADYYNGEIYGLKLEFPYFVTLKLYGAISVQDYAYLSLFSEPVNINLVNVNPTHTQDMSNVFDLLRGSFEGVISVLDFYVLPGITLLTLMMIPLAIGLILVIIKVLRK